MKESQTCGAHRLAGWPRVGPAGSLSTPQLDLRWVAFWMVLESFDVSFVADKRDLL